MSKILAASHQVISPKLHYHRISCRIDTKPINGRPQPSNQTHGQSPRVKVRVNENVALVKLREEPFKGYDVYDHRAGLTLKVAPVLVLLGGISALILISVVLNRTKSKESLAAEVPIEKPKEPSNLIIYSADYRAWNGAGENFDVTEFSEVFVLRLLDVTSA